MIERIGGLRSIATSTAGTGGVRIDGFAGLDKRDTINHREIEFKYFLAVVPDAHLCAHTYGTQGRKKK